MGFIFAGICSWENIRTVLVTVTELEALYEMKLVRVRISPVEQLLKVGLITIKPLCLEHRPKS